MMGREDERRIPGTLLSRLSQAVETTTGLHFPREKWRQLADGIGAAAGALGFADAKACARHLLSAPLTRGQIEILAPHLTVGETYFFREPACFAALEENVLPDLLRSRRGSGRFLRIWSAGCATGEEPYSIAILLDRLIPDLADWRITLHATDINPAALQRAAAGSYGEWSFRGVPPRIKERYFRPTAGSRFEIDPRIRRMVTFSYLNLAEDSNPPALAGSEAVDVVFCRNLLMYFTPQRARGVVQGFYRALAEGGWLVLGTTEASGELCRPLSAVAFPGATLHRKDPSSGEPFAGRDDPAVDLAVSDPAVSASAGAGSDRSWALSPPAPSDQAAPILFSVSGTEPEGEPAPRPTPEAPYEAALASYESGRYAEVVATLADPRPGQPEPSDSARLSGRAAALLARAHANLGQLAEALSCLEIGVALDKSNPGLHYLLATVLQEQGREAEAVLSLRRALYLDGDFVPAHFALGNLARQRGRLQEATRHFRNAGALLDRCAPEEILPESEGMTAGNLATIIKSLLEREASG